MSTSAVGNTSPSVVLLGKAPLNLVIVLLERNYQAFQEERQSPVIIALK
jgi:hypothetical protein